MCELSIEALRSDAKIELEDLLKEKGSEKDPDNSQRAERTKELRILVQYSKGNAQLPQGGMNRLF